MNPKCRLQVSQARQAAGGKPLSDAEANAIDARLRSTMRRLAGTDEAWQTYSPEQRVLLAAQQAAGDIKADAQRKVLNAHRQALKTAEVETRLQGAMKRQGWTRTKSVVEDVSQSSVYIQALHQEYVGQMMDTITAASSGEGAGLGRKTLMFLFDAQNPIMSRDLALEIFAQGKAGTGNTTAVKGAQAWLEVTSKMRDRFNAAGGDVGALEYGYLPQPHDQARLLMAGKEKWVTELLPALNRKRYVNEDGSMMSDGQVLDLLRGAYDTIASDGMNKTQPGQFKGQGARANAGSQSREIHFKDGESYLSYLREYGAGTMYEAMTGHVGGLAKNIGLVERYGPNPNAQFNLQMDIAKRADGETRVFGMRPQSYWDTLTGVAGTPASPRLARISQDIRNIETFGKLQGAVLSSVTDLGTYFVTTGFNKLSYFEAFKNIGKAMNSDTKEFLNMHGLIAESMVSNLNRWSGEHIKNTWSGGVANTTMRLSLMNRWTDTLRHGFGLTMMNGLGRMSRKEWGKLDEFDRALMERRGLTEADWEVMRSAELVDHRGLKMLTPEAVVATGHPDAKQVATRMLAVLVDESNMAIINPDLTSRAAASLGGTQAGTLRGEFARAAMQFKSFPIAMVSRHFRRMLETPQGLDGAPALANRAAYGMSLAVALTALGAIAFQTKQVVTGKDPVAMDTGKFWLRAAAQGGALGIYGDFLLNDTTADRSMGDSLFRSLGPIAGSTADIWELTKGNVDESLAGKDTHLGAEALRFSRSHLPFVNLWYGKAALDHLGLSALQENLSPGYLTRVQSRARKDWNQEFWWAPDESTPARAPDFSAVAGE